MGTLTPPLLMQPRALSIKTPTPYPRFNTDFNHDSDLIDWWDSAIGVWARVGNRLSNNTGAAWTNYRCPPTRLIPGGIILWANYVVECDVEVVTENNLITNRAGILIRASAGVSAYMFALANNGGVHQAELDDWQVAVLAQSAFAWVTGQIYRLKIQVIGTTINCFIDDVLVIGPVVDATRISGRVGLTNYETDSLWDNVDVYPI